MTATQKTALRDLRQIPGVGPRTAEDLWALGIRRVADLEGASDPAGGEAAGTQQAGHVFQGRMTVFGTP